MTAVGTTFDAVASPSSDEIKLTCEAAGRAVLVKTPCTLDTMAGAVGTARLSAALEMMLTASDVGSVGLANTLLIVASTPVVLSETGRLPVLALLTMLDRAERTEDVGKAVLPSRLVTWLATGSAVAVGV